jgi:hypothetical protein
MSTPDTNSSSSQSQPTAAPPQPTTKQSPIFPASTMALDSASVPSAHPFPKSTVALESYGPKPSADKNKI